MECGGGEGDTFTGQLTVDSALTSLHLELDTRIELPTFNQPSRSITMPGEGPLLKVPTIKTLC